MTTQLTRSTLEQSAFWEGQVCLACGATQPAAHSPDTPCEECGADSCIPAATALRVLDLVENSDA